MTIGRVGEAVGALGNILAIRSTPSALRFLGRLAGMGNVSDFDLGGVFKIILRLGLERLDFSPIAISVSVVNFAPMSIPKTESK